MRIWLDPDRLQSLGLTASDVTSALQGQNIQVASGVLDQPPVDAAGRVPDRGADAGAARRSRSSSATIVVKQTPTAVVRLRDVARVELAAQDYTSNSYLDHDPAVALAIFQRPGSNALATANGVVRPMETLSKRFPPGVKYAIVYNPTQFIQQSVDAVIETIGEAILLVVLVVILFLQTWRAAIIPLVAIPVSLIGTFFFMAAFGFTLNNLSLFGLVLAIGIVVDDAIVVVENVERNIATGLSPRDAAQQEHGRGRRGADRHRAGAVRGVRAVGLHHRHLRAVLPPVRADHRRRHGDLADRVADAVAGDVRAAAEAARPARTATRWWERPIHRLLRRASTGASTGSAPALRWLAARAGALRRGDAGGLCRRPRLSASMHSARRRSASFRRSTAAISSRSSQLPPGASLARTDEVQQRALDIALSVPGVAHAVNFVGFYGATFTNAPNAGAIFLTLDPFEERAQRSAPIGGRDPGASCIASLSAIQDGFVCRGAAAAGPRHRHRRRLPHDGRGSRRPRAGGAARRRPAP